ncbi:unnamed protein product [Rhizophagus irregularis]|nr:unnamed protein product [Rhizophagus irregularis]
MTRITRSKRTKYDKGEKDETTGDTGNTKATETSTMTTVITPKPPNVQTRRSSAQTSRQGEVTPLTIKLISIWSTIKSHKDTNVSYRNRVIAKLFMSLPDKKMYPDYYEEIKNPISLDVIKQKIDDGEYLNEEAFEADLELMCENAKKYNVEGSQIHNDAIILQKLARKLLKGDIDKDDNEVSTNIDEVEHNGEIYQVGDYVHIFNEANPSKPNVAHIHRIWENNKGVKGIYVCWYYHPEQTKHQATHKFYENEVFKTNTFHDHSFNDVIEKCYVLQYKDYISGRPKGSESMSVYLCESRYNEHQKNFSKIKNWASTMPDGVPYKKMELVRFKEAIIPKKVESVLVASFKKTMGKTKSEEDRKELQAHKITKYEHDVDSYPDDPLSPSRAITPVRSTRLGRPPRSRGSNRRQTPVTYQHPQSYQPAYDSDHYNYASPSIAHSPYPMTSGYPVTSTPLTENIQPTGMSHQYEFTAPSHEMAISMPPVPSQHQFLPQQYFQAPSIVQQTTPVMQNPIMMTNAAMTNAAMHNSVMQNSVIHNSVMRTSVIQTPIMRNPTVQSPTMINPTKPTINHRSEPILEVPSETAEYFACDDGGNMLWFHSPPVDVVSLGEPMHSIDYLHRREEIIMREGDKKRTFHEITYHNDNQNTNIQYQPDPNSKKLDLVNSIEILGDRWKNDASLLNQRLGGNHPEYYCERG